MLLILINSDLTNKCN